MGGEKSVVLPTGGVQGADEPSVGLTENERRALRLIRQKPNSAQAGLDAAMGITQQSVWRIVASLSGKGLIDLGAPASSGRRGKPSPQLALKASAVHSIGVSIMADAVATALIDFSGVILGRKVEPVPQMPQEEVLDCIGRHLDALLQANALGRETLCGAGVAMTGYFMGPSRTFNPPPPLRHWMGADVAGLVSERLALPAWADNDGNAAAIGEAALGVGRRYPNFAYLYFSAGFGGGVVVEGRLLKGRYGNSGEFAGILPYEGYDQPNLELLRHCLVERGVAVETVHDLVARFDPSWPGVEDWLARVKPSLSLVASACSAILDPDAIVLGGLLPRALAERLASEIHFSSLPRWGTRRPVPDIVPAEAPGDAVLFGAASIPLEQLYF